MLPCKGCEKLDGYTPMELFHIVLYVKNNTESRLFLSVCFCSVNKKTHRRALMRKILLALVALSLFAAAPAHAQQAQKIGLINLQKLMLESAPAAEAKKKMEANFSAEKKEIDKKSEELKKMSEQLRLQSAALTPEAREDKKVEFVRLKRDLEDQARTFTRKVQAADAQIRQDILTVIAKACQEYGKKKGFAAIFDATHAGVAYADATLDVTSEVMVEVNRIWRAGAKN